MKGNELMIEDWVYFHNVKPIQVTRIIKYLDYPEYTPIPITAEILEKSGLKPFKIDKLTEQATAKWWAKGGDYYVKQYNFRHNDFQPIFSFGCHPHTLIERLRYVHELQHALRLCGIDKEIVL